MKGISGIEFIREAVIEMGVKRKELVLILYLALEYYGVLYIITEHDALWDTERKFSLKS